MADVWDLAAPIGTTGDVWDLAEPVGQTPAPATYAKGVYDALAVGWQNSATGLAFRGKMPDVVMDPNATWYERAAANAVGVMADIPLSVAAAGPALRGGPIAAGAAAFAAPMALREALVEAYTHNYAMNWEGVWNITKAGMIGAAKGGLIGAATLGAGKLVAPAGSIASIGAELATLTTASAALEGNMPTWQDFMDNAILLGGMKGAMSIAKSMYGTYAETGKTPQQMLADAKRDTSIAKDLAEGKLPEAYTELALDERIKAAMGADPRPEYIRSVMGATEPPKLGEPPLQNPVKYEYMTDVDTMKGMLRIMEDQYQAEILKQTRGEVSNLQSAMEAMKLVAAGDVAQHVVGKAENAAQIYARADLLKGLTQHSVDTINKLRGIPEADLTPRMKLEALAAIEQVSMALADYRGVRAESGRATQMFNKIKKDSSLINQAEAIIASYEKTGSLTEVSRMVDLMKDPTQLQAFAEKYVKATALEKVVEAWRAGIFSGPLTWQANILGNVGKWAVELPKAVVSSTITAGVRAAKGDPLSLAQYKARALAPLYGLQLAAIDGIHLAGTGKDMISKQGFGATARAARAAISKGDEKIDVFKRANTGVIGAFVESSFGMLKLQDMPFRTVGERSEAYIMAVDRATAEKHHPNTKEFREAVAKYVENPEAGLDAEAALAATKRIEKAGAEAVFSQRLGPKTEQVSSAISGTPWEFIFPARRTPINLLDYAVQHTPGANLLSSRWRADFAAGGEQRAAAIARVVVGTALAATALSMAQDGTITGGGLVDKEMAGTKAGAKIQNYSVLFNGEYYSYQRMEPVAKVMSIAADLSEIISSPKITPEDKSKAAAMIVLAFGNATISTTYMSGLANLMKALLDPERYGEAFTESYATSLVPKVVGQTVTMSDPYKREVDGALDALQSQMPFLRERLLAKRDVWGEPVANDRLFDVMPVATSEASHDKVKTEAVRLSIAISDAPRYVAERGPLNAREQRTLLQPEQRDIYKAVSGKLALELLSPLVNSPDWDKVPDYGKAAAYRKVIEMTRKVGQMKALPPDDAARVKKRQEIIDEMLRQKSDAEGSAPAAPAKERVVK